jgi:hypothetical protein
VPLFWHGLGAQSSTSISHVVPENPGAHVHVKALTPSAHVPLF